MSLSYSEEVRRRTIPLDTAQLPRAEAAEAALLDAATYSREARELVVALPPGAITGPAWQPLVALMRTMHAADLPPDRISLVEAARGAGTIDAGTLWETLQDIDGASLHAVDAEPHARLVRQCYEQRLVIQRVHATLERMVIAPDDAQRAARALVESILDFAQDGRTGFRPAAEAMAECFRSAQAFASGDAGDVVRTGVRELDGDPVGGLEAGDLVTWLMVSGHGKTAAAELIGLRAALAGTGVGFFSAEMRDQQVARRFAALLTGLPFRALKTWDLNAEQVARATYALGVVETLPLYVDDQGTPSLAHVTAQARRLVTRDPRVKLLMIDYVTLVQTQARTEVESVMQVARALKRLAKELGVVIIGLCQVDAKAVERLEPDEQMPQANQASWSQELRNQSDVMICGFRPGEAWRQKTGTRRDDHVGRFSAAKTRNEAGGVWTWSWYGAAMAFDHGCWDTLDALMRQEHAAR